MQDIVKDSFKKWILTPVAEFMATDWGDKVNFGL